MFSIYPYIISIIIILLSSNVNGLIKSSVPFESIKKLKNKAYSHHSFIQLNAEKIDRSASVCVKDFFSNSINLATPITGSHLSAVRMAGIEAINNAKLPFGKDEAWR